MNRTKSWSLTTGADLPDLPGLRYVTFDNRKEDVRDIRIVIRLDSEQPPAGTDVAFITYSQDLSVVSPGVSVIGHPGIPEVLAVGAINVDDLGGDDPARYSSTGPFAEYAALLGEYLESCSQNRI